MTHARTDRKPADRTTHPHPRRTPWQRPQREEDRETMTVAQIAQKVPPHFSFSRVSGVLATLGLRGTPRRPPAPLPDAVVTAPRPSGEESLSRSCGKR